jgi:predicted DNA-binding antitoxin AbrB/MazE fold protein
MKTIRAIFENGVFRPLESVALSEQTPVEFEPRVLDEAPAAVAGKRALLASDLLHSGLVGLWTERTYIADSREFARLLREQAQTRRHDP